VAGCKRPTRQIRTHKAVLRNLRPRLTHRAATDCAFPDLSCTQGGLA
jgi:hypothetical protein